LRRAGRSGLSPSALPDDAVRRRRSLHPDLVVVLVAILGVSALALAERLRAPAPMRLADALGEDGARVAVDARVLAVTHTARGRAIVLAQDGTRATALASKGAGPERGDLVRVLATVQPLADGPGLSVQRVDVLVPAATRPLSPADLARAPADFDGARVLVRGEVGRDGTLSGDGARVALGGVPAPGGGPWLVAGVFRYHDVHLDYVLEAEAWTRPSS
jgi:hypothetical protein